MTGVPEPYDAFAWFYDRYWAGIFFEQAVWAVETLILPTIPIRARILDLCCGTGQLAAELASRGYRPTGVDRSAGMLECARQRVPEAPLVRADARAFALKSVHDAALCLFDSLNHVLDPRDLTRVFRSVRATLRAGSPFLCDVNTEVGFLERWVAEHEVATADGRCRLQGAYSPEERLGRYRFRIEGRGPEAWRRADFELVERCHSDREIRRALAAAGFAEVEVYDAAADLDLPDEAGRAFYLARATA